MKKEIRIQKTKMKLEIATAKYGFTNSRTIQLRIKYVNLLNS
jgi:hypothetical protein